ncbi:Diguanylate cyclase [Parasphingorhabdus sp. NYA22]
MDGNPAGILGKQGEAMVANMMLQRLFDIHKEFWTFKSERDPSTRELIARQQIKLIVDVSRIIAIAMIPIAIYMMANLFIHASVPFITAGVIGMAVIIWLSMRNFRRKSMRDFDIKSFYVLRRKFCFDSIIVALSLNLSLAFPLGFGQIPLNENSVILILGSIVIGGFTYGSIPRAQTFAIAIPTTLLAIAFFSVKGIAAVESVLLLLFFAICVDSIYRLFFFNFAKRHIYAAQQKDAAENVKLLLNDYAEQSSDWLWETDEALRVVRASDRFAAAAGLTVQKLNGMHIADLFADGDERHALLQRLGQGQPIRGLLLPISVDGENHWWRISCRPMDAAAGRSKALRGAATDVTNEKQTKDQVARLAHYDGLTDLPNRALFKQSLENALARLEGDQHIAVLYVDIDRFKAINDTMGHNAGDRVLQVVGNRLATATGEDDIVSRLSGDEFAICLSNAGNSDDVADIASNIVDRVSQPYMIDGHKITTGISLGIVVSNDKSETAEGLLHNADIALYRSKENGRGRVTLFEPQMLQAQLDRREMELDLQAALKRDELELHYQPVYDIETEKRLGYEALIRWNHPTKGMVMPNEFIPIAEATGLIIQLGEWVLRTALLEMRNWPEHLGVSVNLSPAQMRSPNLLSTIINGLASAGVDSNRLELEITETVIMSHNQANFDLLNKIHSLGVKIALDDFGTGYSSLNYLRSFPFNKIKIDRCFVEDVDGREDCQAIIRAVTGLASSLGMVTTAEGIEREGQLLQVKLAGCKQVQGYLFSKAIPASQIPGRVLEEQPEFVALDNIQEPEANFELAKRKIG